MIKIDQFTEVVHENCPEGIEEDGSDFKIVDQGETHEYRFFVMKCSRCLDRVIVRIWKM